VLCPLLITFVARNVLLSGNHYAGNGRHVSFITETSTLLQG
jgi:hypothetical protein